MARVSRLVQTMIERAPELFSTSDNISNPLPITLEEFLTSDQLGQWWRDFRQKKKYFIEYLVTSKVLTQLLSHIHRVPESEESADDKLASQFASLAYGIMVNDGFVAAILENLDLLVLIMTEFQGQQANERANKYFCDFLEVLLRGNSEIMAEFFRTRPEMNNSLIQSIGSGNFCNMILAIAEAWQMNHFIHQIVVMWGVIALNQLLDSKDTHDSDHLANNIRLLRFLVRTNSFMSASISLSFTELVSNPEYLDKLIRKAILDPHENTCVCVIPLVIEILVQNKNKSPAARLTDEDSDTSAPSVEELRAEVPTIILCLLDMHGVISDKLMGVVQECQADPDLEPPPLGFYRFGLVKLIQGLLITNYTYTNTSLSNYLLLPACIDLFFIYYRHSILHSVITYIVRYIMAVGNTDLIWMILFRAKLPQRIIEVYLNASSSGKAQAILDNLRGHLKMLAIAIRNSPIAEEMLNNDEKWAEFVDNMLREEAARSSTTDAAAMAQKRLLARTNLNKQGFTDQLEDKIGR
jgi:hypothetical protein